MNKLLDYIGYYIRKIPSVKIPYDEDKPEISGIISGILFGAITVIVEFLF